jgi:hypothetical protein
MLYLTAIARFTRTCGCVNYLVRFAAAKADLIARAGCVLFSPQKAATSTNIAPKRASGPIIFLKYFAILRSKISLAYRTYLEHNINIAGTANHIA